MRTNIVLDDQLLSEAQHLSGIGTKKEVVHVALRHLVQSLKKKPKAREAFRTHYLDNPIELPGFKPLSRDEIYER